tara:strand:- start:684 stop:881 length:198 start_codon:yes stop_codon:yes gene_type:complete
MNLHDEEYPLKPRPDRSNDPYYQAIFWCYEAQQFFRWEEMQDWYEEQKQIEFQEDVFEEILVTGA